MHIKNLKKYRFAKHRNDKARVAKVIIDNASVTLKAAKHFNAYDAYNEVTKIFKKTIEK